MNAVTADMVRDLIVGHDASRPRSKQRAAVLALGKPIDNANPPF